MDRIDVSGGVDRIEIFRQEYARLAAIHHLSPCMIAWSRQATGGSTRFLPLSINLSPHMDDAATMITMRHEIAHVYAGPGHGHDATWRAAALLMGVPVAKVRTRTAPVTAALLAKRALPLKWVIRCPDCQLVVHRAKRPRPGMFHRTCRSRINRGIVYAVANIAPIERKKP